MVMEETAKTKYEITAHFGGERIPLREAIFSVWSGQRRPEEFIVGLSPLKPQSKTNLSVAEVQVSVPKLEALVLQGQDRSEV